MGVAVIRVTHISACLVLGKSVGRKANPDHWNSQLVEFGQNI